MNKAFILGMSRAELLKEIELRDDMSFTLETTNQR